MIPAVHPTRTSAMVSFFSSVNFFFLQKKLFFQAPSSQGQTWALFFFKLGVIYS